jgi:fructokinase
VVLLIVVCGIAVVDIIAGNLPNIAEPSELVFTPIEVCIGGHACNVSVDLAQIGVPRHKVSAIIAVGRDVFGDFLGRTLEKARVDVKVQKIRKVPTSKDLILIRRGEDRRFHVDPGANRYLSPDFVLRVLEKQKPDLFYVGGVGMLDRLDEKLVTVLREAKKLGAMTFVDVVTPQKKSWDFLFPIFEWTDIFHCNDTELKEIMGESNLSRAMRRMLDLGVGFCFTTMGKRGLLAGLRGTEISMPAFRVEEMDPTGAGDAFCSGLIFKLFPRLESHVDVSEMDLKHWKEILLYASACGAACCTAIGATASVKPKYVEKLIRQEGNGVLKAARVRGL